MRNYVIINGVNSLTIQGLAIKTLPPITKPIQRTLREEIDGRDGDIVTTLGYGAYDKTIEIGLFGTFDIDEVIAYFNQKGTITFSNEADKVYYFQALEQVDYAELLKFRTANVVLHCQPFKYPLNETPLVEEYEYVEATGTNVTLDNTSEAIFNKIDLLGNTEQTQYTGKQLFDYTKISSITNGTNNNGVITSTTNTSAGLKNLVVYYANGAVTIPANTTIYLSADIKLNSGSTGTFGTMNDNGSQFTKVKYPTLSTTYQRYQTSKTYTSSTTINAMLIQIQNLTGSIEVSNIMISTNSSETYEPYVGGIPSPNPNYPQDIHVVSGDNEITICGKNIYNRENAIEDKILTWAGGNLYNSTGSLVSDFIRIDGGQKVNIDHQSNVFCYDKEKNFLGNLMSNGQLIKVSTGAYNSVTIPTGENIYYIRFSSNVNTAGNTNVKTDNIMANLGNTQETYEPFNGETYPISLGDIELCKIGDYQDYLYKENGSWYLHKEIGKVVYEGTTTIDLSIDGVTHKCLYRSNYPEGKITTGTNGAFYERAKYITNASERAENTFYENPTNYLIIGSPTDTLDTLKTKFNGGLMYYPLATPTNTEITDTTLIEQLEAIWNAISYRGQTNITQVSNDLPFMMEVSALKLGSDHLEINNTGNIYSKPTIELEGTGIVDIYLNDVQVFEVDLSEENKITIDTEKMEAYTDTGLANRKVTGDYSTFKLNVGTNDLRFSGALTSATISRYIRWL